MKEQNFQSLDRFIASTLQRSNNSPICPDTHRAEPHVKIGETDPEQTQPGPKHVAPVETSHASVSAIARRRSGKLIEKSAGQMSQGMTTKRITAEQTDIDCENDRPNADAKYTFPCRRIDKPKRFPHVIGEDHNENESEIEKIPVNKTARYNCQKNNGFLGMPPRLNTR